MDLSLYSLLFFTSLLTMIVDVLAEGSATSEKLEFKGDKNFVLLDSLKRHVNEMWDKVQELKSVEEAIEPSSDSNERVFAGEDSNLGETNFNFEAGLETPHEFMVGLGGKKETHNNEVGEYDDIKAASDMLTKTDPGNIKISPKENKKMKKMIEKGINSGKFGIDYIDIWYRNLTSLNIGTDNKKDTVKNVHEKKKNSGNGREKEGCKGKVQAKESNIKGKKEVGDLNGNFGNRAACLNECRNVSEFSSQKLVKNNSRDLKTESNSKNKDGFVVECKDKQKDQPKAMKNVANLKDKFRSNNEKRCDRGLRQDSSSNDYKKGEDKLLYSKDKSSVNVTITRMNEDDRRRLKNVINSKEKSSIDRAHDKTTANVPGIVTTVDNRIVIKSAGSTKDSESDFFGDNVLYAVEIKGKEKKAELNKSSASGERDFKSIRKALDLVKPISLFPNRPRSSKSSSQVENFDAAYNSEDDGDDADDYDDDDEEEDKAFKLAVSPAIQTKSISKSFPGNFESPASAKSKSFPGNFESPASANGRLGWPANFGSDLSDGEFASRILSHQSRSPAGGTDKHGTFGLLDSGTEDHGPSRGAVP